MIDPTFSFRFVSLFLDSLEPDLYILRLVLSATIVEKFILFVIIPLFCRTSLQHGAEESIAPIQDRIPDFTRTKSSINVLGFTTIYIVVFLASSILSLAFFGYFYCLCLLYIVVGNDILQRALQSITKNGKVAWDYDFFTIN